MPVSPVAQYLDSLSASPTCWAICEMVRCPRPAWCPGLHHFSRWPVGIEQYPFVVRQGKIS